MQTFEGSEDTPAELSVSNAGDQIAYSLSGARSNEFYVMPFEAGPQAHWIAHGVDPAGPLGFSASTFSPDDDQIAIAAGSAYPNPGAAQTFVIPNHRGAEPIQLSNDSPSRLDVPLPDGDDTDDVAPTGPLYWLPD